MQFNQSTFKFGATLAIFTGLLAQNIAQGQGNARAGGVEPLQRVQFSDGSGSIELAAGFRIAAARKGGAVAVGPSGEVVVEGCCLSVLDPNTQRGRAALMRGQGRRLPGMYAEGARNGDPGATFGSLYSQFREKFGFQTGSTQIFGVRQGAGQYGSTNLMMVGEYDSQRVGPQIFIALENVGPENPALGGWSCLFSLVSAPKDKFMAERSTLLAMVNSSQQNDGRIRDLTNQDINGIHKLGQKVQEETKEKQDAFDAICKGWDDRLRDNGGG
jgi:hypothetical protein